MAEASRSLDPTPSEIEGWVEDAKWGRLVLSALHTALADGAVRRLVDLGAPEFIVLGLMYGVLAQNPVPVAGAHCHGAGCEACKGAGTTGRRLFANLRAFG